MNILFVMKHRGNAGNTHAVANYIRVAPKYGHKVAMYGDPQEHLPDIKFSKDVKSFDRAAFLFESEIYRLSRLEEVALLGAIDKRHRMIFDMDGMYNPVTKVDDYDFNHTSDWERERWQEYFDTLADVVMKPTLAPSGNPRVRPMIFYGYDAALEMKPEAAPVKQYDIMHLGHNWWRWRDIGGKLLPAIEPVRDRIGEIGFIGLWWDKPPAEGADAGPEAAFESDPAMIERVRVTTEDSVMYTDVVRKMSTAKINIFTQRPVLHHLKHITLKYFEVFYADTIPLLMLDEQIAIDVYGPAARELMLRENIGEKILDALARPGHYRDVVHAVRKHLAANNSYDKRMAELVAALPD
ncbi:MAG: hypothetical protein IPK23_13900 [Rhizobiales bacterium]|nr:hypothetical protein [Hyphomicrobiales bacterium]